MRPLVGVHAAHHLAKSRERRDAYSDRASIGVGICLRLNLEPRRLLHHRLASLVFLSGTLVNSLHRLRDYRHAQWSKCSSSIPSARRSARRSVTRYLAYVPADQLLIAYLGADCPRYGPLGPDPIWIHGSCPWILLAVYFGWLCIFSIFHIGLPPHIALPIYTTSSPTYFKCVSSLVGVAFSCVRP